jgi:glycosyltransferase involved in cell wall biosynthesis
MSTSINSTVEEVRPVSEGNSSRPVRVLTLATVDTAIAKLLRGIMEALRDEGFISEAACADGPYVEELRIAGFQVHTVPFQRRALSMAHLKAFVELHRLIRSRAYDIVHVHTPVAQVLGRIAARRAGVPVVLYTSHGFQFDVRRPVWARFAIRQLERYLARWTDFIFTQSGEDAETAVRTGIADPDRVVWIGNGIELSKFHPGMPDEIASVRREFGFGTDDRLVAFVGRIVRHKGILELIEAMSLVRAQMPSAKLLVIGEKNFPDVATRRVVEPLIQEAIGGNGLRNAIRFTGFRDDVPRLLRAVDLMVLPSRGGEGMPRSIIEAMATGLPVVATNVRGSREEVIHGETGLLVPPRDPDKLAAAILEILSDPDRALKMGMRGRQRALELYDERVVLERQLRVYRRLVKTKQLGPLSSRAVSG